MTDPLYSSQPPKRNLKPFIFIAVLAIAIIIGAVILGGGLPKDPAPAPVNPSTLQGSGLVVDPNAGQLVEQEKVEYPNAKIPGFFSITIPAYTTEVKNINLHNPEGNKDWYYLTYKLCLIDDNGKVSETLFESQLVPPGLYLQDITLSRELAPGEYKATMYVQPYFISDMTPTDFKADLRLTIYVK